MISFGIHRDGRQEARDLLYLPGLHGDSTLVGGFREATRDLGRFLEVGYPRDGGDDPSSLGAAVAERLDGHVDRPVWIVAESYGSLVAWELLRRRADWPRGSRLLVAGGFVRHPWPAGVQIARSVGLATPRPLRGFLIDLHRWTLGRLAPGFPDRPAAWRRFRDARLVPGDAEAMGRRLAAIGTADARDVAGAVTLPVHHASGLWDPVVPWGAVRRDLRRGCPGYRGTRLFLRSDHALLVAEPEAVAGWMATWTD